MPTQARTATTIENRVEGLFEAVFRHSHLGIGITRLSDGRFVEVNDAFLRLFGYRREEVLGRTSLQLGLWVDHAQRTAMLKALQEGQPISGLEGRFRRRTGEQGDLLLSATIVELDGTGFLIGMLTDITARKQAEAALRESESRLRVALKITPLLVFRQDRQLRYTWIANPKLGATETSLIGRTELEVLGDPHAPLLKLKQRVLRTRRGTREEIWVTHAGQTGCFDLIVEPQFDAHGRVDGLLCAAEDITERKRLEAELEQARLRLEQLAMHQQNALEQERAALARDVHDHVGATLTGMRLRLAALAQDLADTHPVRAAELREIVAMADAAAETTRDICTRLRPPALDDLGLAETCRWYLAEWTRATGIRTRGRIARLRTEPDAALRIDLFRMLQELLTNVARHAGATEVKVTLGESARGWSLRVADNGHGFAAHAATRGFGLAGLRERVRGHGGAIEIDSGPGGTTAIARIPLGRHA